MTAAQKFHPSQKAPAMQRSELNFLEFIQTFRRGELLAEGDDKLAELIEAISRTGSSGSLSLKMSIKVNKAGQLEITPDLTIKKPTRTLGVGIYYANDEGRLSRRDPNQMDIEDEIARQRGMIRAALEPEGGE